MQLTPIMVDMLDTRNVQTRVGDLKVSTARNVGLRGVVWEVFVFGGEAEEYYLDTEEEAREKHAEIVERLRTCT